MPSTRRNWDRCPRTFATIPRHIRSFCWCIASTRPKQAGSLIVGRCSSKYAKRSSREKSPRRKPTGSATKSLCVGRRANTNSLSVLTLIRAISTTISITIPRLTIAPGSTTTSSAPALPYGGYLTGYVWKMTCL